MPRSFRYVYQLKVSLKGIRPPIWRRLLVPSSVTLPDLHEILQNSMGWVDAHLHQFNCGLVRFGQRDPELPDSVADETGVRLETVLSAEGEHLATGTDHKSFCVWRIGASLLCGVIRQTELCRRMTGGSRSFSTPFAG